MSSRKRKKEATDGSSMGSADLLKWCESRGAALDGAALVDGIDGLTRGFVTTKKLRKYHCAISVPHSLFLTTDAAVASPVGVLIAGLPDVKISKNFEAERLCWQAGSGSDMRQLITRRSVLYAYLIHQRHVAKIGEEWQPYASSLPATYSTPFSWAADAFEHATLRENVERLNVHLDAQFDALFPRLSRTHPATFPPRLFTRATWLWAHESYTTRCFPAGVFGDALGTDLDEDGVMIPLIDMLNHDHGGCNTGWPNAPSGGGGTSGRMLVHVPVGANEELLFSYGKRTNLSLASTYGFAMWDNPHEVVTLPSAALLDMCAAISPDDEEGGGDGEDGEDREDEAWRRGPFSQRLRSEYEAAAVVEACASLSVSTLLPPALIGLCRASCICQAELEAFRASLPAGVSDEAAVAELRAALESDDASGVLSLESESDALELIGSLLAEAVGATVGLLESGDPSGDEDGSQLEAACARAKEADCVRCGEGEYAVTPRGCQLACCSSQLMVLLGAMDALETVLDAAGGGEK